MHRTPAALATALLLTLVVGCGARTPATAPVAPVTDTPADPDETVPTPSITDILAHSDLPAPAPVPVDGDALGATIHRLSNGMTVYISTDRQKPRFSAWIAVRAGSRHDPPDSTGLAHYLEHMLFKGTDELGTLDAKAESVHLARIAALYDQLRQTEEDKARAAILAEIDAETQRSAAYAIPNELDQLYARMGVNGVNAFTSDEQTVYIADVPSNRLEPWIKVEAERFRDPRFRLFYPELEAVYEEKNISLDNPNSRVFETLTRALFPQHPYGTQTTIGEAEHLKTPAYADMVAYFQRWYVPNNMAIVLAGDVDAATAVPLLEQYFGTWAPTQLTPAEPKPLPPVQGRQQHTITAKGESAVYLAWQTVPKGHADEPALAVLDMLMDNSSTGLINVDLVLSQKLPRAGSFPRNQLEAGYWTMYGTARAGQSLEEVEQLLLDVVGKLKSGAFTQEDLDAIVLDFEIREMRELESNNARVRKMTDAYVHHRPWQEVATYTERLRQVTREHVIAAARTYLGDSYVAVYRQNGEHEPPKMSKPAITPVPIDPSRASPFATGILSMPARSIEPEWLVEGTHYHRHQLPAGQLVAVPNRKNQLFSLAYRFDFGYRQQPLMCLALELLDQSGTKDLEPAALKRTLYAMGTTIRLDCNADQIAIHVEGIDRNLEASVALLDTWLEQAELKEDIRAKLVANTLSRRKDEMDEPRAIAQALNEYVQRGKDSSYLVAPSNRTLERSTVRALARLLAQLPGYRHRTAYFGPRSTAAAAAVVGLGSKHRAAPRPVPVTYRKVGSARIFLLDKDVAQSRISLLMPKQPLPAPDRPLGQLYTEYVGGGMGALIFQELREARGLAYSAFAMHRTGRRPQDQSGVLGYIGTQSDKTVDALSTMLELLRQLPVQPERLQMAKQSLDEQYRSARFEPREVPRMVLSWEDLGLSADPRPERWRVIQGLGEAELQTFGQRFASGDLLIGIMGNGARIDTNALGRIAPVQQVQVSEVFGY